MRLYLLVLLSLFTFVANAQELIITRYVDSADKECGRAMAVYKVIEYLADSTLPEFDQTYIDLKTGKKKSEAHFLFNFGVEMKKSYTSYNSDGKVIYSYQTIRKQKDSTELTFEADDNEYRKNIYKKGELISTQLGDGPKITNPDSLIVDASFPKIMHDYIKSKLRFPPDARNLKVNVQMMTQFKIDEKGKVVDIVILKSVTPGCDKEMIRVLENMPAWKPAKRFGVIVKSRRYLLPITFGVKNINFGDQRVWRPSGF